LVGQTDSHIFEALNKYPILHWHSPVSEFLKALLGQTVTHFPFKS